MDRRIITVPPGFLRYQTSDWDIDWREQSSGTSVNGRRNIHMGLLPRWVGSPTLVFHPDRIPGWRAKRWAARGQTGLFRLTMVDFVGVRAGPVGAVPFSDDVFFSDGTGFESGPLVRTDTGALAGDTEIVVNMTTATGTLQQGQILSHDDFPFGVVSMMGPPEETVLEVEMPFRRDIPAGDLIHLAGRGIFEMVEARAGNPSYDFTLMSRPSFTLQEWLR